MQHEQYNHTNIMQELLTTFGQRFLPFLSLLKGTRKKKKHHFGFFHSSYSASYKSRSVLLIWWSIICTVVSLVATFVIHFSSLETPSRNKLCKVLRVKLTSEVFPRNRVHRKVFIQNNRSEMVEVDFPDYFTACRPSLRLVISLILFICSVQEFLQLNICKSIILNLLKCLTNMIGKLRR